MRRASTALFLLGMVIAAAWAWGLFQEQHNFKKESSRILELLTGGEAAVTTLYEESAYPFREASLLSSFVDRGDRLTQTLGAFEAIESVEEIEMLDTIRGNTARVEYMVRFAAATTWTEISYLKSAGAWQLLGFDISVPDSLADKVIEIDSEYDRIKAPDVVVALVDQTLLAIEEGKGAQVWSEASPPFQESKAQEDFVTLLSRIHKELGSFQHRLKIHSSGQNAAKERARVHALLQYDKAKTSGTFEFIKVEGQWRLLYFKVLIPEPLLPARQP